MRVLVIDDSVDSAECPGLLMRRLHGHDVETAYSGTAGLEAAERFRPDVILLDIGLPGMDGFEAASRLRGDADLKGAVLIALSGYSKDQIAAKHPGHVFDHHLLKPVDPPTLKGLLQVIER